MIQGSKNINLILTFRVFVGYTFGLAPVTVPRIASKDTVLQVFS